MDERTQKIEALQMGAEYVKKLISAIGEIAPELRGDEKEDTVDFLKQIIDGINFMIEITNATIAILNEKNVCIDEKKVEETIQALSSAYMGQKNAEVADILEGGIVEFLNAFEAATVKILEA